MDAKYCIPIATNLAGNFGCNQFRILPEIVFKLDVLSFEVAVLFDWNLSRCPFLQVVNLELLLCTGLDLDHEDLLLCPIFTDLGSIARVVARFPQASHFLCLCLPV